MKSVHFIAGLIFIGSMSIILTRKNIDTINRYIFKDVKPYRNIKFNDSFHDINYLRSGGSFYTNESANNDNKRFSKEKQIIEKEIKDIRDFDTTSLFHHYCLKYVNDKAKEYISNKDIIHIGPRSGEAIYVLSQYTNGKIICVNNTYYDEKNLDKFVAANNSRTKQYVYDKVNLGDGNCTVEFNTVGISGELNYQASKLDEYVSKFDSQIGAIVISGSALDHPLFPLHLYSNSRHEDPLINLLRGGLETIKKHRPILILPYYYSKEFLEGIYQFTKENLPNYRFARFEATPVEILVGHPKEFSIKSIVLKR